jgi:hemerythrin-like domain-containing protein
MSYASDLLVEEHEIIERMLAVLNKAAEKLERGAEVDPQLFLEAADFIRNFADRCHHAKEEDILFKLMAERGIPTQGGPVGVMLTEHEYARKYTEAMEKATREFLEGNIQAKNTIIENARYYARLLTEHIHKENNILYPMGNRIFSSEDQTMLKEKFEEIEKNEIGEGVHQKYLQLVQKLEKEIE